MTFMFTSYYMSRCIVLPPRDRFRSNWVSESSPEANTLCTILKMYSNATRFINVNGRILPFKFSFARSCLPGVSQSTVTPEQLDPGQVADAVLNALQSLLVRGVVLGMNLEETDGLSRILSRCRQHKLVSCQFL